MMWSGEGGFVEMMWLGGGGFVEVMWLGGEGFLYSGVLRSTGKVLWR